MPLLWENLLKHLLDPIVEYHQWIFPYMNLMLMSWKSQESADRIAKEHNDSVVNIDHKPAKNDREGYKDESMRLKADGGHKNPNNYNKRDSPGTKYRKQDSEKVD